MAISVSCPSCHQKLKAPDRLTGKTSKCPKCGTSILIRDHATKSAAVGNSKELAAALFSERETSPPTPERATTLSPNSDQDFWNAPAVQASEFNPSYPTQEVRRATTGEKCPAAKRSKSASVWVGFGIAVAVVLLAGTFFALSTLILNQQASKLDESEVLKTWQQFVARAKSPTRIRQVQDQWLQKHPNGSWSFFFQSEDVKKSDSLKAAYVGTFAFEAVECYQSAFKSPTGLGAANLAQYKLHFGYADGRWEFLDGSVQFAADTYHPKSEAMPISNLNQRYFASLFGN